MARDAKAIRARVSELYPGDSPEMKAVRHRIYSTPNLLASDPSDDAIRAAAQMADSPETPEVPVNPQSAAPLVGEVLTAEEQTALVKRQAVEIAAKAQPVIVKTAEDYEQASLGFAAIQKLRADNEAKRKKLKAPILESGRLLDAEFKATDEILAKEQSRYETPMVAFKQAEREALRKQEADRQAILAAETARLQAEADAALVLLEQAKQTEADPFLSALAADDYDDAPVVSPVALATMQAKDAIRAVAMAPRALAATLPAAAAITATGTKTSYPWLVEVVDPGQVARVFCSPDESKLGALAKRLKAELNDDITKINPADYPGLHIYESIRIGGR